MRSEHPAGERERVIMRGRVLGGLEPTRKMLLLLLIHSINSNG